MTVIKPEEQAIEKDFEVVEEALERETIDQTDEGFEVVEGSKLVSNELQEVANVQQGSVTTTINYDITATPEPEQCDTVKDEKENDTIEVETIGSVEDDVEVIEEVKEPVLDTPTKPTAPEPAKLDAPESTEEDNTSGGVVGLRDVLQDPTLEIVQVPTLEIVQTSSPALVPEILQTEDPITEPTK